MASAIFCILLFSLAFTVVQCKENLIADVCSESRYEQLCTACLFAAPNNQTATYHGLAEIAAVCLYNRTIELHAEVLNQEGKARVPPVRIRYRQCEDPLKEAVDLAQLVGFYTVLKQYGFAKSNLTEVPSMLNSCINGFGSAYTLAPEVVDKTNIAVYTSTILSTILDYLIIR